MGADFVGFIGCELQEPLGLEGFLQMLKLRAYRAAVEQQVPPHQRADVQIAVVTNGVQRELRYADVVKMLGAFEQGCPSCASCLVGQRTPLGCYRYVTYPIDSAFEQVLFEFFVKESKTPDSIGSQFLKDIVSKQRTDTAWHRRGPRSLAQRPEVLKHGGFFTKTKFDSAQVLAALFLPTAATQRLDATARIALLVAFSRLLSELVDFARARLTPGASRALDELESLRPMVLMTVAKLADGGATLFVDS